MGTSRPSSRELSIFRGARLPHESVATGGRPPQGRMPPVLSIGVCEDDPAIRKILQRALIHADHEPIFAFNGAEAYRVFTGKQLDVIIMDIGLPDAGRA